MNTGRLPSEFRNRTREFGAGVVSHHGLDAISAVPAELEMTTIQPGMETPGHGRLPLRDSSRRFLHGFMRSLISVHLLQ